jgi:hypothetical protein
MRKNVPKRAMPDVHSRIITVTEVFPLDIFRRYTSAIKEQAMMMINEEAKRSPISLSPRSPSPTRASSPYQPSGIEANPSKESAQTLSQAPPASVSVHINNVPDMMKCGNESYRKDGLRSLASGSNPTPALFNEDGSSVLIGNSISIINPIISSHPIGLPFPVGNFMLLNSQNQTIVKECVPHPLPPSPPHLSGIVGFEYPLNAYESIDARGGYNEPRSGRAATL